MFNTISSYSEAAFFDGYHFQHIAAYQEEQRLRGIRKRCQQHLARERRATPRGPRLQLLEGGRA
jgi:hypothetical protein